MFTKEERFLLHTARATLFSIKNKGLTPLENKHPLIRDVLISLGHAVNRLEEIERQLKEMNEPEPQEPKAA